jgi:hypothetical protein
VTEVTGLEYRSKLASTARLLTAIPRAEIFGPAEPRSRPLNLQADAALMFPGYVGRLYRPGGAVLLAINPGGGKDGYKVRTWADDRFYPLMEAFHWCGEGALLERYEAMNAGWVTNMRIWNLRRIVEPVLEALGCDVEQVAFMNAVPYRTREDRLPSVYARREAWARVTDPLLQVLQPQVIIALGQKAGDVLDAHYRGTVRRFTVQRSNGDTYVTGKAQATLEQICTVRRTVEQASAAANAK